MAPNDLTPCRMAFYFVSTFAIAQTPTKQPALRLSRTKNLHFAKAPFPGFSAKDEVPNTIAVIAQCFAEMNKMDVDYRLLIESLELKAKTKKGAGFAKNDKKVVNI